jgi:hypothetical protein
MSSASPHLLYAMLSERQPETLCKVTHIFPLMQHSAYFLFPFFMPGMTRKPVKGFAVWKEMTTFAPQSEA